MLVDINLLFFARLLLLFAWRLLKIIDFFLTINLNCLICLAAHWRIAEFNAALSWFTHLSIIFIAEFRRLSTSDALISIIVSLDDVHFINIRHYRIIVHIISIVVAILYIVPFFSLSCKNIFYWWNVGLFLFITSPFGKIFGTTYCLFDRFFGRKLLGKNFDQCCF